MEKRGGTKLETWISSLSESRFVTIVILGYMALFLAVSPLFPGVSWFQLGDFTLPVVNYYHTIMIPFALMLIILVGSMLKVYPRIMKIVNYSAYLVLLFSILGLFFFYPSWSVTADEVFQSIRDVIVVFDAFLVIVSLMVIPLRDSSQFKKIWGAYILILTAGISAEIAGIMGMFLEYGTLFGFSSIGFMSTFVNSVGGSDTFLANLLGSHSHQMLPAVMGSIIAIAAVVFRYEKLTSRWRWLVNVGLLVSIFGTISMSYVYWVSSFGTYQIPGIFTSGPGGVNGLAFDDLLTGIVGVGGMIAIAGIYTASRVSRESISLTISELGTWVAAMFVMVGIGYLIEFNEAFYSGSGASYDSAFLNGHMLFTFFLITVIAGVVVTIMHYGIHPRMSNYIASLVIAGTVIGSEGVLIYTMTLAYQVEAIGLILIVAATIMAPIAMYMPRDHPVAKTAA
ncbi:MAG: hypothetical protein M1151_01795 [Candidatus Thermoplasmatota archaeon]|jgi:hypothetical protein|nr:hypothetical protein [Candidatus Thermoplasmatota archaeon]